MAASMRDLLAFQAAAQGAIGLRDSLAVCFPRGPISLQAFAADPAKQAIARFYGSAEPGVWPHIPKGPLVADLLATVGDPFQVAQDDTPLCGPAAILFELAARQPARLVEICQELYETGRSAGRTKLIQPSDDLRNSVPPAGISLADWVVMATLRDVENAIFDVEGDSSNLVMGLTTPWEMKGWAFEILGYDRVASESTLVYGEFDAIRAAERARNAGGVAFLLIDSAMLGGDEPLVALPNHWVSFLGDLVVGPNDSHVHFQCYSWGSTKTVDLDEESFEDYMWWVVTGEP
jgi:hypothetical protein